MLKFYAAHAGRLSVAWCFHMAGHRPCLTGVLRMILDELKLGERWDVCRVEEVDTKAHPKHAECPLPQPPTTHHPIPMPNAHRPSPTAQVIIVPIDPNSSSLLRYAATG